MERLKTDFLFARPSFLSGMARVLDLFGIFDSYNESREGQQADVHAMYADWRVVGQDIYEAAATFDREHKEIQQRQLELPLAR